MIKYIPTKYYENVVTGEFYKRIGKDNEHHRDYKLAHNGFWVDITPVLISGKEGFVVVSKELVTAKELELRDKFYGKVLESKVEDLKTEWDGQIEDNSQGRKYDGGKPLVGTMLQVFPRAFMGIGAVILKGKEKYPDPENWKKVEDGEHRYRDALMRHLIKHCTGEEIDKESGKPHLVHVAWNALAILELYLMENTNLTDEYFK